MLVVDLVRAQRSEAEQTKADSGFSPPLLWALLDVSLAGLSNPTVAPSAHIIHFFRSASFTMATSRHLYA